MEIKQIYDILLHQYGPQNWWPVTSTNKAFEIIIGAILTQNTAWSNVEKAIKNLKESNLIDIEKIMRTNQKRLAKLIKSSGYNNQKAERLKIVSNYICNNYGLDIKKLFNKEAPELREELLGIKGIGPETADSIILYAAEKPVFVIDAYTKRIFSRLGFCKEDIDYEELQCLIKKELPLDTDAFKEYHALLVKLAKTHCKKKPVCDECPLRRGCHFP